MSSEILSGLHNQLLRGRILKLCFLAHQTGLGADVLEKILLQEGFNIGKNDVINAFNYLKGKGLIHVEPCENKILGLKREIASILPKGIDVLEGTEPAEGIEL